MFKQFGSATVLCMAAAASALVAVTPAAAQVSRYHMDFKPADFNPLSPGLVANEANIGPTQFAMPGFGWDETHGQLGRPGVFFPNVATGCVSPGVACNPEDPTNRAFIFLFGGNGQTSSTFTSTTTPGATGGATGSSVPFPAGGIDPTLPDNAGLGFSWSQHLAPDNGPTLPVHVRIAVQTSQAGNWYVSNKVFDTSSTPVQSQGNFDPQSLLYNPLSANWLDLTIGATAAAGVTFGSVPTANNLSGNITGVGFVASFINSASSTVHIDFIDIGIPPVPGDVTGDRTVTIDDYNIIKANFGTNVAGRTQGDLTNDGVVNLLDFAQWKSAFVPGSGSGSLSGFAIPEPASAVLMALGLPLGWGLLRLRKKNSA